MRSCSLSCFGLQRDSRSPSKSQIKDISPGDVHSGTLGIAMCLELRATKPKTRHLLFGRMQLRSMMMPWPPPPCRIRSQVLLVWLLPSFGEGASEGQTGSQKRPAATSPPRKKAVAKTQPIWAPHGAPLKNEGGGNCMYLALAQVLKRSTGKDRSHRQVRAYVTSILKREREQYFELWLGQGRPTVSGVSQGEDASLDSGVCPAWFPCWRTRTPGLLQCRGMSRMGS